MATQASYLTDIQAMNPSSVTVQQVQNAAKTQQSGSPIQQSPHVVQAQKVTVSQSTPTTIIQPAHAHSGQSYIVTTKHQQATQVHSGQSYIVTSKHQQPNQGQSAGQSYIVASKQQQQPGSQVQSGQSYIVASKQQQQQPGTQVQSGQSYIISSKQEGNHEQYVLYGGDESSLLTSALNQDHGQETVTIQQGNGQTVYPHVQYVEGTDQAIYAAANGQMQTNYPEYNQTTMYAPVSGTYYQTSGSQGTHVTPLGVQGVQGQIITHQGGTFLVQQGTMDGEGTPLGHTTRASPATVGISDVDLAKCVPALSNREVQWLIDNYETAEGVSLPRSTLYNHYLRHCQEQNLDPMNPASFGKLIRSVFLGLRTRRLGTRGNSKYHYYGIRIKAGSTLNQYTDDQTIPMRQQPLNQGKRKWDCDPGGQSGSTPGVSDAATTQQHQHQQYLGDASGAIPNFGDVDLTLGPLPDGVSKDHIKVFEKLYREHAESILDVVVNLQFSLIEALWQGFWRHQPADQITADNEYEKRLPKDVLYSLCKYEGVQNFVRKSDYAFYQTLVKVLIPDVLRPIPSSLTQAIRNFAKSLENWLKGAMHGVPEEMIKTKIGAVSAFAQTLRRYTSLNHLAQAARAVLQNTSQINQMLTDLNRVDFANVQEQASWVCQCEDGVVHQLEQDFKKTLQQQNTLEEWAVWLEGVVNQVLKPHEGSPSFPKAARQFLLKWSFYSSMVIRDLTLRSAASFGSFHLIRLLYDEFMFYLVEHKVAAATGETPIAVMGEFIDLSSAVALGTLEVEKPSTATTPHRATVSLVTSAPSTPGTSHLTPLVAATPVSLATNLGIHGGAASVVNASLTAASANLATSILTPTPGASTTLPTNANNTTTVTVLASGPTNMQGAKTIVVLPVSAGTAGGDAATISKRLKLE
uniref:Regulatory factor X n=1 Tax=Leptochiton asellus TaxID=211853 RepID=A0A288XNU6_9MOLL|nr:regulatory factor X [Leptochiton asellus]